MADPLKFDCKCCGECCSGLMKVFLNPEDLVLMAKFLKFSSTTELFSRGFVIIDRERNNAPLPRIRFKSGKLKFCPFIENRLDDDGRLYGLCSLHPDHKPLVCMLAPHCREYECSTDTEKWSALAPVSGCPGWKDELETEPVEITEDFRKRLDRESNFFCELEKMIGLAEDDEIINMFYIKGI